MKKINRMAMEAKRALDRLANGKTYTTSYVLNRLQKSAYLNSWLAIDFSVDIKIFKLLLKQWLTKWNIFSSSKFKKKRKFRKIQFFQ